MFKVGALETFSIKVRRKGRKVILPLPLNTVVDVPRLKCKFKNCKVKTI